jgi:hypothetical protein
MLGKRFSRALAAAIVVLLGCATTAWAAGNSVHVNVPSSVKLGTHYQIKTFGHVAAPANDVVGFEATVACKSTYKAELKRLGYPQTAPLVLKNVSGSFSKTVKFHARTGGTIYWCAYVINGSTLKTYATAFDHFKEHH